VTHQPRLPLPARWLLWLSPVPRESRAEVHADLLELFVQRRRDRGAVHAHWRLYHDVASLWLHPQPMGRTANRQSSLALLGDVRGDLRYAVRLFARQPAILLLTIVGLSLGLAIATAAFSIMNAAVLRGEGVVDPDRAPGVLKTADQAVWNVWQYDEFLHLREGSTRMQVEAVLTDGAGVRTTATEGDGPLVRVAFVSGGFFAATGGRVVAGRPLESGDERSFDHGGPPVVVSFVFWTSRLNRDPQAVGRTIRIGRMEATIVGVAERGFSVPAICQLWVPLPAYRSVFSTASVIGTPDMPVEVFGRLLPNVGLPEAEAQLSGVAASMPGSGTSSESKLRVRLDPHAGLGRVSASNTLAIAVFVFAVIGLVLLLACANVATVLISTAITREREMGVRAALGASRWRIVRQLVTESLALGTIAAAIGLVFAYWALPMIGTMIEAPAGADLAPDLDVYLFLGIVTIVSGVAAGLAPAWHSRGVDLVTPLKGEGARQDRVAPRRLRSMLVATQAAVSVLLIVLATLFTRATFRAATIDVGFDAAGLYVASAAPGGAAYNGDPGIRNFWARAISELQTVPGIQAVTLAEVPPFGTLSKTSISRDAPARSVHLNRTRAEYFDTLGLRILDGRTFTHGEIAAKAPVALVSQSLARAYWHCQSPLGQMLPQEIPLPPTTANGGRSVVPAPRPIVIGVVADAITARLHEASAFAVFEPLDPGSEIFARLIIRVAPGATGLVQQVSQRLRAIDPQADIRITSVAAGLQQEAARPRMLAMITGTVGLIAIVLCVIGLYGLTASVVGQRAREMGVRVALGAESRDLLRLLMMDSLRPVVLGLAIGAGAALLASRVVVAAMFFGVSPQDPVAFVGAAAILIASATLAVLVPTRRAASVDAALVLRRT
jgi:putative ABC transport system permease protein